MLQQNNHLLEINDDLLERILSNLGDITLSRKKSICRKWEELSTLVINRKVPSPIKPFQSKAELKKAFLNYIQVRKRKKKIQAEEIASTYGWPIGK